MYIAPTQLYTAFSFIGFVLCAIPLYWHLEAWNTGTCLYMIWAGLGCLMQCINSIVWNKNIINKIPVYCDISTRIQVALNVAIPACSLCINRRLYKIASVNAVVTTRKEKRQAVIQDLLIGVGIPILQIIAQYIVSPNRYNIFEDFGPGFSFVVVLPAYFLFLTWPVIIGTVSLFYCVRTIYIFYTCQRQFSKLMLASGLSRGRYLRLMAIGAVEVLGTIPLGTYIIVHNAKDGVNPWKGWAETHNDYSRVVQVAGFIWKNDPTVAYSIELYRWSLVACAFIFFALFGFADEARVHYRRVYTSLAGRIGFSTLPLHEPSRANSSLSYVRNNGDVSISVPVVTVTGDKRRSSVSFIDQLSIQSISIAGDIEPEFKIEQCSSSVASSSVESLELKMQGQSTMPAGIIMPTAPASIPPHFSDKSTMRPYSGVDAV